MSLAPPFNAHSRLDYTRMIAQPEIVIGTHIQNFSAANNDPRILRAVHHAVGFRMPRPAGVVDNACPVSILIQYFQSPFENSILSLGKIRHFRRSRNIRDNADADELGTVGESIVFRADSCLPSARESNKEGLAGASA